MGVPPLWIGTSGWHYPHWRGLFYPSDLSPSRWLAYYAQHFPTVELNAPFYRLPSERAVRSWAEGVPSGFRFAVKASRWITHIKRLAGGAELALFLERVRFLGKALGPILYQLPPTMRRDTQRLEGFLTRLPRDMCHAIEFRHPSWFCPEVYALLRRHGVALCLVDMVGFSSPREATGDFLYVRFHGTGGLYWGSYTEETLRGWAWDLQALSAGLRPIWAYFNNDAEAAAVHDALRLRALLEGKPPHPAQLPSKF
ncbi:MAG: DUF72 domain-containing protein [Dehalococcoidia bacterium]|nr:DUF72 domain-containing protein [Dehalococcoidia bacterium]MDW8120602.1 DUF72 domain-containing protein [Chloroflexota bacterium]